MAQPSSAEDETRELVCEICRLFYTLGWVSGTGGSISIKCLDGSGNILMAPSGVQKERMLPGDIYLLDADGGVLKEPAGRAPPYPPPKLSECQPLFMAAFKHRQAGAVMHSHALSAVMATALTDGDEFRVTNLEMIKGLKGNGFYDDLVIPIIENTAREYQLTESLERAILAYPHAHAVLVRRHGIYVWGDTWIQAKTQAECLHYLFEAFVEGRKLGINFSVAPSAPIREAGTNGAGAKRPRQVTAHEDEIGLRAPPSILLLDIEGTLCPISFVSEVLFPYARKQLPQFLKDVWMDPEWAECIEALRVTAHADGVGDLANAEDAATYCDGLIAADRKVTPLKDMQGRMWRTGYECGELQGTFFDEAIESIQAFVARGTKVYIYSSGSREAQRLMFQYSMRGDLRKYICGYFDTTVGSKLDHVSYASISKSLGVDLRPGSVDCSAGCVFVTDVLGEATAAMAAGWSSVFIKRPGNKPQPPSPMGIRTVNSLGELL